MVLLAVLLYLSLKHFSDLLAVFCREIVCFSIEEIFDYSIVYAGLIADLEIIDIILLHNAAHFLISHLVLLIILSRIVVSLLYTVFRTVNSIFDLEILDPHFIAPKQPCMSAAAVRTGLAVFDG